MKSYVTRLRDKEWLFGNGQCPSCGGLGPKFYHGGNSGIYAPSYDSVDKIGHEKYCLLARMMKDRGMNPIMLGKFDGVRI